MSTKERTPIPRRMRVGKRMYSVEVVEALIDSLNPLIFGAWF